MFSQLCINRPSSDQITNTPLYNLCLSSPHFHIHLNSSSSSLKRSETHQQNTVEKITTEGAMSSLITEDIRAKATELYRGNDVCMAQARRLFKEVGFPNGLLPLRDVEECGYVEETGFVWLKQKKEIDHKFEKINKLVRYATEVTAYVEPGKIKKLTGVKAKEIIIWVTINEITVDSTNSDKIIFKNNATGVKKVFPTDAFVVEIDEPEVFKVAANSKVTEVKEAENKTVAADSKVTEVKEAENKTVNVELKETKDVDAIAAPKPVEVKDV